MPLNVLNVVFANIFSDKGSAVYDGKTLTASKDGGGHINVDFETSGLSSFEDVAKLINLWEFTKHKDGLMEPEPQTAARIGDSRYYRTEKKFCNSEKRYSGDLASSLTEVLKKKPSLDDVSKVYWARPQVNIVTNESKKNFIQYGSIKVNEDELKICTHNQAINIEHIFDENEANRRIEFREFVAQKSIQDILDGFEIISEVLMKIENVKDKFDKMDISIKEGSETDIPEKSNNEGHWTNYVTSRTSRNELKIGKPQNDQIFRTNY